MSTLLTVIREGFAQGREQAKLEAEDSRKRRVERTQREKNPKYKSNRRG